MASEARKLVTELRFSAISIGSSDSLKGLLDVIKDTTIKVRDAAETADRKRATALDARNNLINRQKRLLEDIEELNNSATKLTAEDPSDSLRNIIRLTKVIAERDKERVSALEQVVKRERELKKVQREGDPYSIKQAESFVARGKDVASTIQAELKSAQDEMRDFEKALLATGATSSERAVALVEDLIATEGTLKATNEGLEEIARQRQNISDSHIANRDLQLRQVLQNTKFELEAERRVSEAAVKSTRLRVQAENSIVNIQKELLTAKANILEIDVEIVELGIEDRKNQEVANELLATMGSELNSLLAQKAQVQAGTEEENRLTGEILAKRQLIEDTNESTKTVSNNIKLRVVELKVLEDQYERVLAIRELAATNPIGSGLLLSIENLVGTITDISLFINQEIAQSINDAVVKGFDGATDILGEAIVEALDPTDKGFSIREAFASLFRQISKDIFQSLTSTISKALLASVQGGISGLISGGSGGYTGVGSLNFNGQVSQHRGGKIPTKGAAHPAHYTRAQGLHSGGRPKPPPGVHPKDTVPIWAQPGEFMQPLNAVQTYGTQFMEAVRTLSLDPMQARALAGASSIKKRSGRTPKVGYATGGSISGPGDTGGGGSGGGVGRAVVVSDEQTYDRLLAQGRRPFMEMIKDNSAEIQAMLNSNRGAPIG